MARRVLMAEASGGRVRGRPRLGWMDGVKVSFGNREMRVKAAKEERVESPGAYATGVNKYVTFTRPFLLGPVYRQPPRFCKW